MNLLKEDCHDSEDRRGVSGALSLVKYWFLTGIVRYLIFIILTTFVVWGVGSRASDRINLAIASFVVGEWEETSLIASEYYEPYKDRIRVFIGVHPYIGEHFDKVGVDKEVPRYQIDEYINNSMYIGNGKFIFEDIYSSRHYDRSTCVLFYDCGKPVTFISYIDAKDTCEELSGRIPTHKELSEILRFKFGAGVNYHGFLMEWSGDSNGMTSDDYKIFTKWQSMDLIVDGYLDDNIAIDGLGFRCIFDIPEDKR